MLFCGTVMRCVAAWPPVAEAVELNEMETSVPGVSYGIASVSIPRQSTGGCENFLDGDF